MNTSSAHHRSDLAEPFRQWFNEHVGRWERRRDFDTPWDPPDLPHSLKACCWFVWTTRGTVLAYLVFHRHTHRDRHRYRLRAVMLNPSRSTLRTLAQDTPYGWFPGILWGEKELP